MKNIKILLFAIIVLSLAFFAVSCGKGANSGTGSDNSAAEEEMTEDSYIYTAAITCASGNKFFADKNQRFVIPENDIKAYGSEGQKLNVNYSVTFNGNNVLLSDNGFFAVEEGVYELTASAVDGNNMLQKTFAVYSLDKTDGVYEDFETDFGDDIFTGSQVHFSRVNLADEGFSENDDYAIKATFDKFTTYCHFNMNLGHSVLAGTTISFDVFTCLSEKYQSYVLELFSSKSYLLWQMVNTRYGWQTITLTLNESTSCLRGYFNFGNLINEECKFVDGEECVVYIDNLSFNRYNIVADYAGSGAAIDVTGREEEDYSFCLDDINVNIYDNYKGEYVQKEDLDFSVFSENGEEADIFSENGKRYFAVEDSCYNVYYGLPFFEEKGKMLVYKYTEINDDSVFEDFESGKMSHFEFSQVAIAEVSYYESGDTSYLQGGGRRLLKLKPNNYYPTMIISGLESGASYSMVFYVKDPDCNCEWIWIFINDTEYPFNPGIGGWYTLQFKATESGTAQIYFNIGRAVNPTFYDAVVFIDNVKFLYGAFYLDYENITFEEGIEYGYSINSKASSSIYDYSESEIAVNENGGNKALSIRLNSTDPTITLSGLKANTEYTLDFYYRNDDYTVTPWMWVVINNDWRGDIAHQGTPLNPGRDAWCTLTFTTDANGNVTFLFNTYLVLEPDVASCANAWIYLDNIRVKSNND